MTFRITGLDAVKFEHMFGLSDEELQRLDSKRYIADSKPGFPCRVSLEDAEPGEPLLLVPYAHHTARTAYASKGPIFVRERPAPIAEWIGAVPLQLKTRLISLRAYDPQGMMIDADVMDGRELEPLIDRFLSNGEVGYLHAHFARRGCYAALIERT